jgi:DNA-binding NtrC family response regulator
MEKLSVLVLDDEERIVQEVREFLENMGFQVHAAGRPSAAFAALQSKSIDIALIDIKLPEYSGLTFLRRLKDERPEVESIVMSGHGDMESVIEAFRIGAFDYLRKPFSSFDLKAAIERIRRYLDARDSTRRYARLCEELNRELIGNEELIGDSQAIQSVRDAIATAAAHPDAPVLIQGESGTGKELVARRIHALSSRSSGRFVAVNCAAVPREMFESEFFGHAKGAFTDAHASRNGLFKTASGGALFLDEVGEIPLDLQAKLLRVIEDGRVRPVGSDMETQVSARVLCATNKNLLDEVKAGRFRGDLYYRLAVVETYIPPLRERPEDIGLLAEFFYSKYSKNSGRKGQALSPDLIARFKAYAFPGNVRELKNLIERIFILGRDPMEKELCAWLNAGAPEKEQTLTLSRGEMQPLNLENLERETIRIALGKTGGNCSAAAGLLGITRQSLERRLFRYGMK